VDLTDVHLVSATGTPVTTNLGTLAATLDSDTTSTGTGGQLTWTYTVADSAVEYLAKDQTRVESFTITLNDQNGSVITKQIDVTITGTNDAPVITAEDLIGAVTEQVTPAGNLTNSGVISFTDVDLTDVHLVSATGTPVTVVLIGGSAVTMGAWFDRVGAVIDAWYPGERGGEAIAGVLFGDDNPAGRLPITFPMSEGQLPLSYNHKPTGRGDDYVDSSGKPAFPFGFGLSYTSFDYSDLILTPREVDSAGGVTVRCTVKNTGTRAGDEIVQAYVSDVVTSVTWVNKALRGFARVPLAPGEKKTVQLALPWEAFELVDAEGRRVVEAGDFEVLVGPSSRDRDLLKATLRVE